MQLTISLKEIQKVRTAVAFHTDSRHRQTTKSHSRAVAQIAEGVARPRIDDLLRKNADEL